MKFLITACVYSIFIFGSIGCKSKNPADLKRTIESGRQFYELVGVSSLDSGYKDLRKEVSFWHFGPKRLTILLNKATQEATKPATVERPDGLFYGPLSAFKKIKTSDRLLAGSDRLKGRTLRLKEWPQQMKAFIMRQQADGSLKKDVELTFKKVDLPSAKFSVIWPDHLKAPEPLKPKEQKLQPISSKK